jgi:hypothetical protein
MILVACPFTQPQQPASPPPQPPQKINPGPIGPANASPPDKIEQEWLLINNSNVEGVCLSQAKKEAVAQGYNESVVFSCTCTAQESPEVKSYACAVSALDGAHNIGISCAKGSQACKITSQQGTKSYTFDQLSALGNS